MHGRAPQTTHETPATAPEQVCDARPTPDADLARLIAASGASAGEAEGALVRRYAPRVQLYGRDCGYLGELTTRTLLCGDLFSQPGHTCPPVTEQDILGPSEAMRRMVRATLLALAQALKS